VPYASIGPIAIHLPAQVETNDDLQREFPDWDMPLIGAKTGVAERHLAAPDETASDLGVAAALKLFQDFDIDPHTIDFVLLCTQTPDYPLPTTACLLQQRLGLRTNVGAIDFNLGCSGFVYGLSLADGLIRTGVVKRILLITAETYSKYIDKADRSLRPIFGDGAAATLIDAAETPSLSGFVFGTDGSGADTLIVNCGGARPAKDAIQPRHRQRWKSSLYMDGPSLITMTVANIPDMVEDVLKSAGVARSDVKYYLMHQATVKMLEQLMGRMQVPEEQMPIVLKNVGNTVSSTIPIVIETLRRDGRIRPGDLSMLVGFGVGFSWAGCLWRETWSA